MEAISALSLAQAARLMPAFFLAEDIEAAKFVNSGSITDGGFSYMTVKRQLAQDVLFRKGTLPRLSRQSIYSIFER
jgi:hypothetical protein